MPLGIWIWNVLRLILSETSATKATREIWDGRQFNTIVHNLNYLHNFTLISVLIMLKIELKYGKNFKEFLVIYLVKVDLAGTQQKR